MRRKQEAVLCFESNDDGLPKVVRGYRDRYRAISQVLDDNPEILSAVHKDLRRISAGSPKAIPKGDRATTPRKTSCGRSSFSTSKGCPSATPSSASAANRFSKISRGCEKGPSWTTRSWTSASSSSSREPGKQSTNCWVSMELSRRPSARTSSAPTRPSWNPTSAIPAIRRSCGTRGAWRRGC